MEAILSAYPTLPTMWAAYESVIQEALARKGDGITAARRLLSDLPVPGGLGRVGEGRAAKVYDLLFAQGVNLAEDE